MKLFRIDYSGVLFVMAEDATQAVSHGQSIVRSKEIGVESLIASNASPKRVPKEWEMALPFNGLGDKSVMEILNGP
jgi:hypothetical protein